jgi:3-hydroxyisobutyrate dehydrogenase
MSTLDVAAKAALAERVRAAGGELLDCPISGGPALVAPRIATTFASGDQSTVDSVRPVLDALAGPWVYAGAFGAGAHLKYISSLLLAVHTVAAAEAITLAERSGLDLDLVQSTLDNSIAGSAILRQRGPMMRSRAWSPAPGPIDTLHPILVQVEAYAAELGVDAGVFAHAKSVFDRAVASGWGELDIASVHDMIDSPVVAGGGS